MPNTSIDNSNSILNTIKKMLGLDPTYTAFDTDIVVHINSAFMMLNQLGVISRGYHITGDSETWANALGSEVYDYESIKDYIYIKVRLLFDPPQTGFVTEALKQNLSEIEYRLVLQKEIKEETNDN